MQFKLPPGGEHPPPDIEPDAAGRIPAHLGLGAVGVVDPHLEGIAAERPDCNHAIRSDADVAVAEVTGHRRNLRRGLPAGFDQNEIVAETMPF